MNKKIFTLLASLLMLFFTAFVMNAQPIPGGYDNPVQYLPEGIGKGAYHLQVTHFGAESMMNYADPIRLVTPTNAPGWGVIPTSQLFVSMDEKVFCI